MSIYNAPIRSIDWQTVDEFLAQNIKEGAYVDYKVDWPKELERTITAMANTLGGVILIGVDQNTDGGPKQPVAGVKFERGMEERVTNIVLSNITPPVFPEVAVCADAAQSKAIVVIRVPESHLTPHAIMGNRRVYVRTGNRNKPEELATLGELEWLQEHRAKALSLRNQTYQNAVDRSDYFMGYTIRPMPGARQSVIVGPYLLLCATPFYPRQPLITPPELRQVGRDIRVKDYYRTAEEFPIGRQQPRMLQDGVYFLDQLKNESGERTYYTELGVLGQLFYRQTLLFNDSGRKLIRASEIFARLDQFMRVSKRYLGRLSYQGTVWFHLLMGTLDGSYLGHWYIDESGMPTTQCHDEAVAFEGTLTIADWESQSEIAMIEATQKIAWAYDWDMERELIKKYLAKHRAT